MNKKKYKLTSALFVFFTMFLININVVKAYDFVSEFPENYQLKKYWVYNSEDIIYSGCTVLFEYKPGATELNEFVSETKNGKNESKKIFWENNNIVCKDSSEQKIYIKYWTSHDGTAQTKDDLADIPISELLDSMLNYGKSISKDFDTDITGYPTYKTECVTEKNDNKECKLIFKFDPSQDQLEAFFEDAYNGKISDYEFLIKDGGYQINYTKGTYKQDGYSLKLYYCANDDCSKVKEVKESKYKDAAKNIKEKHSTSEVYSPDNPSLDGNTTGKITINCENFSALHTIYSLMLIIAPILVIVLGSVDYAKAVMASNLEKMTKFKKKFPIRLILLIVLFLVPLLIKMILSLNSNLSNTMMYCIINGKSDEIRVNSNSSADLPTPSESNIDYKESENTSDETSNNSNNVSTDASKSVNNGTNSTSNQTNTTTSSSNKKSGCAKCADIPSSYASAKAACEKANGCASSNKK